MLMLCEIHGMSKLHYPLALRMAVWSWGLTIIKTAGLGGSARLVVLGQVKPGLRVVELARLLIGAPRESVKAAD